MKLNVLHVKQLMKLILMIKLFVYQYHAQTLYKTDLICAIVVLRNPLEFIQPVYVRIINTVLRMMDHVIKTVVINVKAPRVKI